MPKKQINEIRCTFLSKSENEALARSILSGFLLENISYRTLFPYAVVFSLLSFCTMSMVKHGDAKPAKKESILENFDVED